MKSQAMFCGAALIVCCGCGPTPGIPVTSEEANWPFTVEAGTLRCDRDGARLMVRLDTGDGRQFGLNGSAKSFGWPNVDAIMKPGLVPADVQTFITRGLTLCQ